MQFIGTGDRILTENFNVGYLYTITFKTGIYSNSACIGIGDNFVMFQRAEPDLLFNLNINTADEVDTIELYDSGGGTNDYDDLVNRPQINSHTLTGNMSGADLGLQNIISDLDTIRAGAAAGATAVQPADMASALAAKQDALSTVQLDAVNSGITSTDVEQITTNKNNISLLSPTDYSTPTVSSNITLRSGGIYKVGRSVTLCVRINVGAELAYGDTIFTGLPLPVSNTSLALNTKVIYAANDSGVNIGITREGNLVAHDAIAISAITINCTYLATQ